tara:strand:+ start:52 stop:540 length:489 start_codon:yes stop_codon:yes gene_type:complete
MKKALVLFSMLAMAAPAHADITSKMSTSIQLTVNAAATQATRLGNSFSISGNNVTTSDGTNSGALTTGSITSGIYDPGTITATQATAGETFTFNTSFTQGDAIPTSAATVGAVPNFSNITSTAAGSAGDLAGTIDTSGTMSLTAGGAGTSATGQFVTEIFVR